MSDPRITPESFWAWHHDQVSQINSSAQQVKAILPTKEPDVEIAECEELRHHWLIARLCDPFVMKDGSLSIWSEEEKDTALQLGVDLNAQRSKQELTAIRDELSKHRS